MASLEAEDCTGGMPSSAAENEATLTDSLRDVDLDLEEKALRITADDLNHKHKQV
jgi:hypothetical protein